MPSLVAWLDASVEEQRRMREIANLFTQSESRDELGIGQVRDAFSDSLFPGTSTLHTRAKYLLFVPWCYLEAESRGLSGPKLQARVDKNERRLIVTLKNNGAGIGDGLIGRLAGAAVKNLPSSLYWSALKQYGILAANAADALGIARSADPDQEELAERGLSAWSPSIPSVPKGFPRQVDGTFELARQEAEWLQEHMLSGTEGTLLHHLLAANNGPDSDSEFPWEDAACRDAPQPALEVLEHARLFSLAIHGAALLYNLLIAERYEKAGHSRIEEPIHLYSEWLDEWAEECSREAEALATWERTDFWTHVLGVNPRVAHLTRSFLTRWFDYVTSGPVTDIRQHKDMRKLVARQERAQKGPQSRLVNDRLLASWSGGSGVGRLWYRWPQVKRLALDVHAGLGN